MNTTNKQWLAMKPHEQMAELRKVARKCDSANNSLSNMRL